MKKGDLSDIMREEGKGLADILDMAQAAELLNTSKPTLYRWLGDGTIKGFKAGGQWRFYRKDLVAFLKGHSRELDDFRRELDGAIEFFEKRKNRKENE